MTYTKKKIIVEVDVPDGATHYEIDGGISILLLWYRLKNSIWTWWDDSDNTWRSFFGDYTPKNVHPIEGIE